MRNKLFIINILVILTIFLASCNLPKDQAGEGLSLTAAAQTVQAITSATSTVTPIVAGPPTSTPTATIPPVTNTPVATATSNCNVAQFVTDVTVPDGTIMTPNQAFTKKWRIRNIGSCTWSGFSLTFDSGDSMNGPASKPISTVNPNQEVDLELNLTAPGTVGNYRGYWRILTNGSVLVPVVNGYQGKSFYVDIKVQNPATATNTSGPLFAVTGVTYSLSTWNDAGHVNCPRVVANITTNAAGTVTYHWTRSDGSSGSTATLVFASAGTQSINYDWALGSVWAGTASWVGIYIDGPNHQDFGHLAFTTACTSP